MAAWTRSADTTPPARQSLSASSDPFSKSVRIDAKLTTEPDNRQNTGTRKFVRALRRDAKSLGDLGNPQQLHDCLQKRVIDSHDMCECNSPSEAERENMNRSNFCLSYDKLFASACLP